MKKNLFVLLFLNVIASLLFAQNVAIAPSRLYFKTPVGEYKTQKVNLTNNSSVKQSFTVTFTDFEPSGSKGKSQLVKSGDSKYSCAEWLNATPSFFEVAPGETQEIVVTLQVPSSPEANQVKWSAMQIKLTKERVGDNQSGDKNSIGMGITETFQFVVHVFQTPPSVTFKKADIENFAEITAPGDSVRTLMLHVRNSGDAILDCASYLELTNVNTGDENRQRPTAFTLLPGWERELNFIVPKELPAGKYSVLGVVDYGSRENVQAAETEITIAGR